MSPRCGTYSGYQMHRRRGEDTDQACRDAAAAYMARYRTAPENRKREAARKRARERALTRLASLFGEEYRQLYRAELGSAEQTTRTAS